MTGTARKHLQDASDAIPRDDERTADPPPGRPVRLGDRVRSRSWTRTEWPSGQPITHLTMEGFGRSPLAKNDVHVRDFSNWCHADGASIAGIDVSDPRSTEDVTTFRNQRDHFKDLWEQSCRAVDQLCREAEAPEGAMHDLWTLRACIQKLKERRGAETPEPASEVERGARALEREQRVRDILGIRREESSEDGARRVAASLPWKGRGADGSVGFDCEHDGRRVLVTFPKDGDVEILIAKEKR
jgi:hypothetical protein